MSLHIDIQRSVGSGDRRFDLDVKIKTQVRRIALFGPSGAGKTLTVQAISGLLRPDSGRIAVGGRVFYCEQSNVFIPAQQRRLAYLLQDYGLFPHLTVGQNISFGLKKGWFNPRGRQLPPAAQRWVEAFELERVVNNYPAEISGGQKQRTAMARALALKPDLLMLDEPLAALDVGLRLKMRAELAQLQQHLDIPSIIITHDPDDALALADEVFHIQNGRIVKSSTTQELLEMTRSLASEANAMTLEPYQSIVPNNTLEALKIA